jgi:hypothetical protein
MKRMILSMVGLLFAAATAILTAVRPVTLSSLYSGLYPGSNAVDNNLDTMAHTAGTEVPWINIQLAESTIIKSVAVIMRTD